MASRWFALSTEISAINLSKFLFVSSLLSFIELAQVYRKLLAECLLLGGSGGLQLFFAQTILLEGAHEQALVG